MKKIILISLLLFSCQGNDEKIVRHDVRLTWSHSIDMYVDWDKNKEIDLAGFRLYSFSDGDSNLVPVIDVGRDTFYTVVGVDTFQYSFQVTAYDTAGNESKKSEIAYWPPKVEPPVDTTAGTIDNPIVIDPGEWLTIPFKIELGDSLFWWHSGRANGIDWEKGTLLSIENDDYTFMTDSVSINIPRLDGFSKQINLYRFESKQDTSKYYLVDGY